MVWIDQISDADSSKGENHGKGIENGFILGLVLYQGFGFDASSPFFSSFRFDCLHLLVLRLADWGSTNCRGIESRRTAWPSGSCHGPLLLGIGRRVVLKKDCLADRLVEQ
jgi:hypothetical protein